MNAELVARLKAYVTAGSHNAPSTDDAFISSCLDSAIALVDNHCGTAIDRVPVVVLQDAYVEVGSELYNRRSAPNGISQFASPDANPIRIRRNPLEGVLPMLNGFLPGGFA